MRVVVPALVVATVLAGIALRFDAASPLWLDEALSVHIASLPIGDIPEALRHDGHPPLYYFMLHGWMELVGDGPTAVRALSGLFSLVMLPLAWLAGRRIAGRSGAWAAVVLLAMNPYAIRYATETRMYSLLMVLVLCGWLLIADALSRPTKLRLLALAAVSGTMLLTQYWSFYVLAATAVVLAARAWRSSGQVRRNAAAVAVAVAAGAIAFLPWLPSFVSQAQHTGTPWARQQRPTTVAVVTLVDFAGGVSSETALLAMLLVVLVGLALFGRTADRFRVEIDLRTRPDMRGPLLVSAVTFAIALVAGYIASSAYASRYAAVVFPIFIVAAGVGVTRLADASARILVLALAVLLSSYGVYRTFGDDRTQAGEIAQALRDDAEPGDIVAFCPDQLGPAVSRAGLPEGVRAVVYPTFGPPERVDWVDYEARNSAADPEAFAEQLLDSAGPRSAVYLVHIGGYRTFGADCERIHGELASARRRNVALVADDPTVFEHAWL
ncbi:MAG: glycosyltransferase family 39 protein, partial [Actinomycetota bacterium]